MKKFMVIIMALFISLSVEAKPKHLQQIEDMAVLYIYEITKVEWDTLVDTEGEPFLIYKRRESLDKAYDNLVYALDNSLCYLYKGEPEDINDWINNCPIFMYTVKVLGFDGLCDQRFAEYLTKKEYFDLVTYFYARLLE